MNNTFDKTGVTAALTAGNLKTQVKNAIKLAQQRTSIESAEADLVEAREYLALFKVRADVEAINTVEDLTDKIDEIQTAIDDAKNGEEAVEEEDGA